MPVRTASDVVRVRRFLSGVGVALIAAASSMAIYIDNTGWLWWLAATATLLLPVLVAKRRVGFRLTVAAVIAAWVGVMLLSGLISLIVLPCAAWSLIASAVPWPQSPTSAHA